MHLVIIDHDNVSLNLNSVVCNVVVVYDYMFMVDISNFYDTCLHQQSQGCISVIIMIARV